MLSLINSALSSDWVVDCYLSRAFTFTICFYTHLKLPGIKNGLLIKQSICAPEETWGESYQPLECLKCYFIYKRGAHEYKGRLLKVPVEEQYLCLNNFEYNASNIPKERGERRNIYAEVAGATTHGRWGWNVALTGTSKPLRDQKGTWVFLLIR